MKIFLDTRDIIDIVQKTTPAKTRELKKSFFTNGHELVVSLVSVLEISAPLITNGNETNVMRLLNSIEEFPVIYIRPENITRFELEESCRAVDAKREYTPINPFVKQPAELFDMPYHLINASLAELIFELRSEYPDCFKGATEHTPILEEVVDRSRKIKKRPPSDIHFREVIKKHFLTNKLKPPLVGYEKLADWIFEDPKRCPSVRFGYEVFQKFERNNTDTVKKGDLFDYSHVDCLPYVDAMTLERRMSGYLKQADKTLGTNYSSRIYCNADELMEKI